MNLFTPGSVLLASAAFLFSFSASHAQNVLPYFEDFEAPEYVVGGGLTDNDEPNAFQTNNPFTTATSGGNDGILATYFPGQGQAAFVGGLDGPTIDPLTKNVVVALDVVNTVNYIGFDALFAISSSTTGSTDEFGFTLRIGNTNYATLLFTPNGGGNLNVTLSAAGSTGAVLGQINYNALNSIALSIDGDNIFRANLSGTELFASGIEITNGLDASSIDTVGVVWNITGANASDAGNNAIIFDNVTVVPEPSTVGLAMVAGLGGLGMILRRRKSA
jgi:hypothetical protein